MVPYRKAVSLKPESPAIVSLAMLVIHDKEESLSYIALSPGSGVPIYPLSA